MLVTLKLIMQMVLEALMQGTLFIQSMPVDYFSGTITNGGSKDFSVTVPAGIKKLKLTLVWNDPPALPNAEKALINDLDILLENALTGNTWRPWVLNSFPHPDSLLKPAERKRDSLNNVEQITLDNPDAGVYLFRINGI